jgi:HSP20 family protein
VLTLAGERPSALPMDDAKVSVFGRERFAGSFRRAVTLPDDADPARVEAKYRDGVLCVSVARREEVQPKRITIQ